MAMGGVLLGLGLSPVSLLAAGEPPFGQPVLRGKKFKLSIAPQNVNFTGKKRIATVVNGIAPGETFRYQFTVRQSGTYWYCQWLDRDVQTGRKNTAIEASLNHYQKFMDSVYNEEGALGRKTKHLVSLGGVRMPCFFWRRQGGSVRWIGLSDMDIPFRTCSVAFYINNFCFTNI